MGIKMNDNSKLFMALLIHIIRRTSRQETEQILHGVVR